MDVAVAKAPAAAAWIAKAAVLICTLMPQEDPAVGDAVNVMEQGTGFQHVIGVESAMAALGRISRRSEKRTMVGVEKGIVIIGKPVQR